MRGAERVADLVRQRDLIHRLRYSLIVADQRHYTAVQALHLTVDRDRLLARSACVAVRRRQIGQTVRAIGEIACRECKRQAIARVVVE